MIAVTGITGHSGGFFLQEVVAQNYPNTIRCLVRETSDATALDRSGLAIEKVTGDIEDEKTLHNLLHGASMVLHIAGIRSSNKLLKIAEEERVKRAVLVHTTGIFSKHRMAAEEYLKIESGIKDFLKTASISVTILRPTMIFGDLCDHNIHKFIRMVDKLPLMPEIDHGKGRIQPVNARDLGKAYYQALMKESLPKFDYVVSGERSITMHELFAMIGRELGKKTRFISCPINGGEFLAKAVRLSTFGKADFVEKVLRMGENRDFSHEEAFRDFNYQPEPFEIGLRREIEQYKCAKGK
ncbi:MAG: hypothetical protein E7211_20800 [Clostridium lundense]|nr:hypothetical protein [Clostridium lundense]